MRRTAAILLATACILGLTATTATANATAPAPAPGDSAVDLPTVAGYLIQTVTAIGGLR
ncbi:hypothetical protein [Streptomyces sp. NPDC050485]|uniref:hypothetical protein n=1 Tax=Streptomyces sp. NPDC050485 TaxID=3365617 RepID=UPI003796C880